MASEAHSPGPRHNPGARRSECGWSTGNSGRTEPQGQGINPRFHADRAVTEPQGSP